MSERGYLAASVPLRLASAGTGVALPILAVQELGDVGVGAAMVAASLGPSILAAPAVGVALDRARHPKALVFAAGAVTAVAFAVAAALGPVPPLVAVLALAVAGCVMPFFMGGLSSFVADEIEDEQRAYAYDALSYNVASVAGPAIVALLVAMGSARTAMIVLAGIALLGAGGVLATRLAPRPATGAGVLATVAAGARHLLRHRPIAVVTLSGTVSMLGGGALPVVAVALALERWGAPDQGSWIVTAFAAGGLVGAVAAAARRWTTLPPILVMAGGFAATGVFTFAAVPPLGMPWTIAMIGASGFFTASSAAAMLLLRKQQSPVAVRSQVFTVGAGLRATSAAIGAALVGVFAGVGGDVLLAAVGAIWVVSAVLLVAYPRDAERVDEPVGAAISARPSSR